MPEAVSFVVSSLEDQSQSWDNVMSAGRSLLLSLFLVPWQQTINFPATPILPVVKQINDTDLLSQHPLRYNDED